MDVLSADKESGVPRGTGLLPLAWAGKHLLAAEMLRARGAQPR